MRIPELIERKRKGEQLPCEALEVLINGFTQGNVPDYQVAAWLMAVCWRGMTTEEIADLTEVMANSGRRLDLSSLGRPVADKHSTGGVGDKTSLVVVPLVAACGVPVAKMSGRGLGFSGGTLDKMEAIPGLSVDLEPERFVKQVDEVGLAIVGQSPDLAPADGKLYALRDVTATVESVPLIASSIMSKKLAAGAQVIVLDVKVGSGAFMKKPAEARQLAETMSGIGLAAGRSVAAYVTDMSQPLGRAVGNALEVAEAIETLQGRGPSDLTHLAIALAGEMLWRARAASDRPAGQRAAAEAVRSGAGHDRLAAMVRAQGGDERFIYDPRRLPAARLRKVVTSPAAGLVGKVDARAVADAAVALGAGREKKDDLIDPAVGILLAAKVGERVEKDQPLATLHANDQARLEAAQRFVIEAFHVAEEPVALLPLIHWKSD